MEHAVTPEETEAEIKSLRQQLEDQKKPHENWSGDLIRYLAVSVVLLLVMHRVIVNSLDLNGEYLWIVSWAVPCGFGFAYFWWSGRGWVPGSSLAIALGIMAVAGMTISSGLNSGEPIMPQTRFEWEDNIEYAIVIAFSFIVGYRRRSSARSGGFRIEYGASPR
jgi:hypothetical protein